MTVYAERTVRWFHNSYSVDAETGCHIWHGRISKGKAQLGVGTAQVSARRASYAIAFDELPPDDVKINVTCGNRLCVNVEHFALSPKSLMVGEGNKYCSKCKKVKPLAAFSPCKAGSGSVFNYCRPCFASHKKHEYDRNPEVKFLSRLRQYGLTREEYEAMYAAQNGQCAICGGVNPKRPLAIDHDHETGTVRALLCNGCNGGIALLKHDPRLVERALDYLLAWNDVIAGKVQQLPLASTEDDEARETRRILESVEPYSLITHFDPADATASA